MVKVMHMPTNPNSKNDGYITSIVVLLCACLAGVVAMLIQHRIKSVEETLEEINVRVTGVNVLMTGATCKASSEHVSHPCARVFDGILDARPVGSWASKDQTSGAWIEINLPTSYSYTITGGEIWSRCIEKDQYKGVDLEFSDKTKHTVQLRCTDGSEPKKWENCDGVGGNKFHLKKILSTKTVRMNFHPACVPGGSPGLREVELYGKNY